MKIDLGPVKSTRQQAADNSQAGDIARTILRGLGHVVVVLAGVAFAFLTATFQLFAALMKSSGRGRRRRRW